MKELISFILFILLAIIGCDATDPLPPTITPGLQEDIPWYSLADSPWPMGHHDPQSTGRSQYVGPQQGILAKIVETDPMSSSIVVGYESTIFLADDFHFKSSSYDGVTKWDTVIGFEISSSPLISSDTTIFINSRDHLYAFHKNGDVSWVLEDDRITNNASLTIGLDGTLYMIGWDNVPTLLAIDKTGKTKWSYPDSRFGLWWDVKPSFSPDGKTLYIQGEGVTLIAFDVESQTIKWTYGNQDMSSSPLVDSQGNIYVFGLANETEFTSLSPEGEVRWSYPFNNRRDYNVEATIDNEGNLYFGVDTLYSVDYEGTLRWKYSFSDGYHNYCSIVSDINGTIYLGLLKDIYESRVEAISETGEKIWTIDISGSWIHLSPVIAEDGTLFYPTRGSNFLIIK